MKRNILVFPCGSEIALEIYQALRYSTYFHVIGASSVEDHGKYVFEDYIGGLPFIDDPALIGWLKEIVEERGIEAIYPTMDQVITTLKKQEEALGCKVIAPPVETTEICLDKGETYRRLQDTVRVPQLYTEDSVKDYPVFVKPRIGYGGRGTKIIRNREELREALSERDNLLVMEYMPGEEYTVDCYTDRHGKLLYCGARVRNRIRAGISVNTYFCEDQAEFEEPVRKINEKIAFSGAWFAQFKRDGSGKPCLMEIAARLGGASTLSRARDINFPQLSLFEAFGYDVSVSANGDAVTLDRAFDNVLKIDRAFDAVYVDYDDCLILEKGKVNAELVSFLFRAVNRGIRVVMLTKHIGNLEEELKEFRIRDLFDEIIHLAPEEDKAKFIVENALVIDDSFAERANIRKKTGAMCIGPDVAGMIRI